MLESLEDVLADERENANRLRINGHANEAALIDRVCDRVARAAEDFIGWLSEGEAVLRGDKGAAWYRRQFPAWQQQGWAKQEGRTRYYRPFLVPVTIDLHAVREAARRGEKLSA